MKNSVSRLGVVGVGSALLTGLLIMVQAQAAVGAHQTGGGSEPQAHKGLEISVSGVARATNVSLGDCRPGANVVRGVIRPGDTSEFLTVTIDITVLSSFESVIIVSPRLHDVDGQSYRTAQAFTDLDSEPSYSCDFSYRVPPGTKVASLTIEDISFDLTTFEQ